MNSYSWNIFFRHTVNISDIALNTLEPKSASDKSCYDFKSQFDNMLRELSHPF